MWALISRTRARRGNILLLLLPNNHIVDQALLIVKKIVVQVGRGGRLEKPVEAHRYVGL